MLEEVRRRRAEGEAGASDVVSMLVAARYEDGSPLSEQELRDELLTLLTDGPTSTSLAWAFERLLRNPEKLARARREIARRRRRRLPRRGGQGDAAAAPAGPGRRPAAAASRCALGGYDLPAGTIVAPCIHLIHRASRRLPGAAQLRPRALPRARRPGTYTWIPFGGGVRRCLAASYAELEMKRVLRAVLRRGRAAAGRGPRASGCAKARSPSAPTSSGLVIARAGDVGRVSDPIC